MSILHKALYSAVLGMSLTLSSSAGALSVNNGALNRELVFYGTYGMAAEASIPGIEQAFDSNAFFEQLATVRPGQRPINAVRVWWHFHWSNAFTPFNGLPRSSTDTNRRGRYDFSLNTKYLDRLERFVAEANRRGIVVQLCLFDGCMLETSSPLRWANSPYNRLNNRDPRALTNRSDFFKTSGDIWAINRLQVDTLTSRLGNYPNVIWEVMNEGGSSDTGASSSAVLAFHKAVAARLKSNLRALNSSALVSVNADSPALRSWAASSADVDIVAYHLKENDAEETIDFRQFLGRKPVIISNDGHRSCFSSLDSTSRAKMLTTLVRRVLAADGPGREGRIQLEILDNSLVAGHVEQSADYDPRANRVSPRVLDVLKNR